MVPIQCVGPQDRNVYGTGLTDWPMLIFTKTIIAPDTALSDKFWLVHPSQQEEDLVCNPGNRQSL